MNTIDVFLILIWLALILLTLIGSWIQTVDYALKADRKGYPLWQALGGTVGRGLIGIVLLSLLIGLPLDIMGL